MQISSLACENLFEHPSKLHLFTKSSLAYKVEKFLAEKNQTNNMERQKTIVFQAATTVTSPAPSGVPRTTVPVVVNGCLRIVRLRVAGVTCPNRTSAQPSPV